MKYFCTHNHHPLVLQSYLESSFGDVMTSTVQDNALGVVLHNHGDNSAAGKGHTVEIGAQGDVIAERMQALRQPVLCPWKQFTICGHRVDWLEGSGFVRLTTTRLQKDRGLGLARESGMTEKLKNKII